MENNQLEKKIGNYIYQFKDYLGQGSYSSVFLGHDVRYQQKVAIKIIELEKLKDQYNKNLFQNEIQLMKKLNTEHLVQLFDVVYTCNNGDLAQLINKKQKIQELDAKKIILEIIYGYLQMLEVNIIHRDLKCENIFINDGSFKIGDFGFATKLENKNDVIQTESVGTPLYMSPQCMQKQPYSSKTDIWSLGIIFYELLYGDTPWQAQTEEELLSNIYRIKIKFPSHINISNESKNFILRCLQIEEVNRISWDEILMHKLFTGQISQQESSQKSQFQSLQKQYLRSDSIQKSNFSNRNQQFLNTLNKDDTSLKKRKFNSNAIEDNDFKCVINRLNFKQNISHREKNDDFLDYQKNDKNTLYNIKLIEMIIESINKIQQYEQNQIEVFI